MGANITAVCGGMSVCVNVHCANMDVEANGKQLWHRTADCVSGPYPSFEWHA